MASDSRGRRTLPLFDSLVRRDASAQPAESLDDRPTLEAARRRLGGKGETDATAGAVVRYLGAGDAPVVGVVVYAAGDEVDVWLEGDRGAPHDAGLGGACRGGHAGAARRGGRRAGVRGAGRGEPRARGGRRRRDHGGCAGGEVPLRGPGGPRRRHAHGGGVS
jgi:hypothetical protein